MQRALRAILVVVAVALATACNTTPRTVVVSDPAGSVWSSAEEFCYTNRDSLLRRDIKIVVRYDRGYDADSIAMRVLTISPDSLLLDEPFVLRVPRLSDLRPEEQTFLYRSNVQLKHKGDYIFRLTPETAVEGIASVGILIEE